MARGWRTAGAVIRPWQLAREGGGLRAPNAIALRSLDKARYAALAAVAGECRGRCDEMAQGNSDVRNLIDGWQAVRACWSIYKLGWLQLDRPTVRHGLPQAQRGRSSRRALINDATAHRPRCCQRTYCTGRSVRTGNVRLLSRAIWLMRLRFRCRICCQLRTIFVELCYRSSACKIGPGLAAQCHHDFGAPHGRPGVAKRPFSIAAIFKPGGAQDAGQQLDHGALRSEQAGAAAQRRERLQTPAHQRSANMS